jgi:protein-disulfide isomerase
MVKRAVLVLLFFVIPMAQFTRAQMPPGSNESSDLTALNRKVEAIGAQQKQILDQLNELKRLLAANARPNPQPPLPSTLAIQHELFRGDAGARIAIVEYADYECPYVS